MPATTLFTIAPIRVTYGVLASATSVLVGIISVTAVVSWTFLNSQISELQLNRDNLRSQLQFYAASQGQLPDTLNKLHDAAAQFVMSVNDRKTCESQKVINSKLSATVASLQQENKQLTQTNAAQKLAIDKVVAHSTLLPPLLKGQSAFVVQNTISFGVTSIDEYDASVKINLEDKSYTIGIANKVSLNFENQTCTITLDSINSATIAPSKPASAIFRTDCQSPAPSK